MGEYFGVKPKYMSAPSFDYELRTADEVYTIHWDGRITKRDGESILLKNILNQSLAEDPGEAKERNPEKEHVEEDQFAGKAQSAPQRKLANEVSSADVKLNMEGQGLT